MIIAFITMFLGLTAGDRTVEVAVADSVARVELLLDGTSAGVMSAAPFKLDVDFGDELAPHHLVAVARDGEGRELGRTEQWINLPRKAAEAEILLSSDGAERTAALVWNAAVHRVPEEVSMSFDGEPLEVVDPKRVVLPPHNPEDIHFLRAELRFTEDVEAVAEAVFGGIYGSTVSSDIQAVAVNLEKKGRLKPAALAGWLTKGGEPLPVRSVDNGPADVVLVVDLATQPVLQRLRQSNQIVQSRTRRRPRRDDHGFSRGMASPPRGPIVASRVPIPTGLDKDDRLRFVAPVGSLGPQVNDSPSNDAYTLFSVSSPFTVANGGIFALMARVYMPVEAAAGQRLADAVAVAGRQAFAGSRRRLVVLVVGDEPVDNSRFSLPVVRRYLSRLGVPLAVWRIRDTEGDTTAPRAADTPILDATALGEVQDISSLKTLKSAMMDLRRELDSQRILWVDGRHLPQQVEITPVASARLTGALPDGMMRP